MLPTPRQAELMRTLVDGPRMPFFMSREDDEIWITIPLDWIGEVPGKTMTIQLLPEGKRILDLYDSFTKKYKIISKKDISLRG